MIAPIELTRIEDAPTLVELPAVRFPWLQQLSGPIVTQPIVRTATQPAVVEVYQLPRDRAGRQFIDVITPNPFTPTLDLVADAVECFRVFTGAFPAEIVLSAMRYCEMWYGLGFEAYYAPIAGGQHIAIPYIYESEPCYQVRCRG